MTWKDWGELVKIIAAGVAILSPAVVLYGWRHVNRQANERESRKEVRQLVDRAIKLIETAVELGVKIRTPRDGAAPESPSGPPAGAIVGDMAKLKFQLAQLSALVQSIKDRQVGSPHVTEALIAFRAALTGEDFETAEQKPWEFKNTRWQAMSGNATRLASALERAFVDQHGAPTAPS